MTTRPLAVLPCCVMLAVMAGQPGHAQPSELQPGGPTKVTIARGATLEFRGVNGDVLITKAPGEQALVTLVKEAGASEVRVMMLPGDRTVTICTVYPSKDPKKPNECLPGGKGRLAQGNPKDQPVVRFKLEIPAGVNLTASTGFGNMRSESVEGDLAISTLRGDLAVIDGGAGAVQASVGLLGNIDALISSNGGHSRRVKFDAVGSGRIRVALPTSLRVFYSIATQSTPTVDPAFTLAKATGPLITGHLGPVGDSDVSLSVDTGIAGQFVLRRAGN